MGENEKDSGKKGVSDEAQKGNDRDALLIALHLPLQHFNPRWAQSPKVPAVAPTAPRLSDVSTLAPENRKSSPPVPPPNSSPSSDPAPLASPLPSDAPTSVPPKTQPWQPAKRTQSPRLTAAATLTAPPPAAPPPNSSPSSDPAPLASPLPSDAPTSVPPKTQPWQPAKRTQSPPPTAAATLTAAPPAAPPKLIVEGVDFSDPVKMKGLNEKIIEEAFAQTYMITQRKAKFGADPVWDKLEKDFHAAIGKLTQADIERKQLVVGKDDRSIQKCFDNYKDQVTKIRKLTDDLKPQWIDDQRLAATNEGSKKKKERSSTDKMLGHFGEEFLVNAKMAEVMAKQYKLDPYEKSKDGVNEPMEMGEIAAIYGYSTQDYEKINNQLRGNPDPDPVKQGAMDDYIEACASGLKKLPKYKGSVVRCDRVAHFIDDVVKNGQRTAIAFLSTGEKIVPGFGEIETHISNVKTGKNIAAFSLHQSEGEILFPPGSVFKFKKFVAEDGTIIKDHKTLGAHVDKTTIKGQFYFEQSK